jgi:hypothetical protein
MSPISRREPPLLARRDRTACRAAYGRQGRLLVGSKRQEWRSDEPAEDERRVVEQLGLDGARACSGSHLCVSAAKERVGYVRGGYEEKACDGRQGDEVG